ncbi:outer membrane lipid asymmetry maintenance protein MlaD [Gemmobacter lanyuensis]|uniref:Outer membrane lipid asymmetry maintenance protein MlaD n=1 Tax=Gemmobacter lanyuensis TaxID=1054497 RepID=A0A918J3P9_9RHOB|nr:outer membrane lipid asymmetry maintenance protein MlaD [Gemmobacter lanyuensis]GGW45759.1 outer membrane lipid asymmetry maintenance protein MlaD [Gemmobacter lanyuensis]
MSENTSEILAGGAVLAVAAGFLFYAAQGTGLFAGATDNYDLRASFQSAEGITVGTDVRLAGVKVGTVSKIDLNPQTFYADATLTLREQVQIPDDSAALVSSEGLLGGNYIELRPGGSPDNLPAGAEIEDTQGSVSLIGLLMKFVGKSAEDAMAQ